MPRLFWQRLFGSASSGVRSRREPGCGRRRGGFLRAAKPGSGRRFWLGVGWIPGTWLNQSRSGSSSGIHSLTACHGGSMGSMVSMSKGGGGGRGRWMMPSQRPWRRRKNSISSRRMMVRTAFHGALAAGTLERVAAPHLEDEVAPEGAHVAGPAFGRCGDEEDLGGRRFFGWRLGLG